MIKVVIADDIKILQQGLKAIIENYSEIEVVGLASDGKSAYKITEQTKPDVVLMDMRMPEYDGEYGIRLIKEKFPEIRVLVLTTFDDDETVSKAMASGADGYILKEMENDDIINAIKTVNSGLSVFGSSAASKIHRKFSCTPKNVPFGKQDVSLTERELNIIKLIADGMDNKEISAKLFIAEGTVRNNISKMLDKLELKDRTQLAVYAIKNNIV